MCFIIIYINIIIQFIFAFILEIWSFEDRVLLGDFISLVFLRYKDKEFIFELVVHQMLSSNLYLLVPSGKLCPVLFLLLDNIHFIQMVTGQPSTSPSLGIWPGEGFYVKYYYILFLVFYIEIVLQEFTIEKWNSLTSLYFIFILLFSFIFICLILFLMDNYINICWFHRLKKCPSICLLIIIFHIRDS